MIDEFVDRKAELSVLERDYRTRSAKLIIIYGRRRIGKTELIKRYLKGKNASYYLATDEPLERQLQILSHIVGEQIKDDELSKFGSNDIEAILYKLYNRSLNSTNIIVIDEYPKLLSAGRSITSKLQRSWDEYLSRANVILILSGSSISMMQEEVLNYSAPLYGRSSRIFKLKPLTFKYAKDIMPTGLPFIDRLRLYFIFGGIPAYYRHVKDDRNLDKIIETIVNPYNIFLSEPSLLLSEETHNDRRYISTLNAIANGFGKPSEIARILGINQNNINRYTWLLENIDLIKKEYPVTAKTKSKISKQGSYIITDNFINFYFANIYSRRRAVNEGNDKEAARAVLNEIDIYSSHMFESFSKEFLVYYYSRKLDFAIEDIGRWWGRNPEKNRDVNQEEIDIVALNENTKDILFGECKWTNNKVDVDLYYDLQRKSKLVQWHNGTRREHFILFSKTGFTMKMRKLAREKRILLIDLDAIEKAVG